MRKKNIEWKRWVDRREIESLRGTRGLSGRD